MRIAGAKLLVPGLALALARQVCADSLDHWDVRTSGTGKNLYSVAYGSGLFVAVGQTGTILVSTNAATWSPATNNFTSTLYGVARGRDLFVAVGDGGTILTSSDAVTWTLQLSPATNSLKAVRSIGEGFLAVGSGGTLLGSTNGASWTLLDSGSTMTLQGVALGEGTFAAVGGGSTQNSSITRSLDGITWSNQTVSFNYLYDVTFGNGVFVAQGIRGQVWVSTNAVHWTQRQAGDTGYLLGATFAQGLFVAVGEPHLGGDQKIVTSIDGTTWQTRPVITQLSPPLHGVCYGNGYFVAVGEKGLILQSGPVFRLTAGDRLPVGGIQWVLSGEAGRSYHFQQSMEIGVSNWTDLTNFMSTAETTVLTDPTAGDARARFYRVTSP